MMVKNPYLSSDFTNQLFVICHCFPLFLRSGYEGKESHFIENVNNNAINCYEMCLQKSVFEENALRYDYFHCLPLMPDLQAKMVHLFLEVDVILIRFLQIYAHSGLIKTLSLATGYMSPHNLYPRTKKAIKLFC